MLESKHHEELGFNELYDRYESMVRAYVVTIVKNNEITEDVVQETFIRFFKTVKKGNEFPNVPGFLITVSRNICLNRKRKGKYEVSYENNVELVSNYNEGYENKELLELIIISTEYLKDKYRRAYMLKEFEGMTYKEIAEIESIALSTAKIRVLRARKMIIKTLKPYIEDLSK